MDRSDGGGGGGGEVDGTRRIGSVKAAINMFGEKTSDAKYSPKKATVSYSEVSSLAPANTNY